MDRLVVTLGHIIIIPSQPVFALCSLCCVLSGEVRNTYVIVFGMSLMGNQSNITNRCSSGADPGFQVRGRTLKNCAERRDARNFFGYFL